MRRAPWARLPVVQRKLPHETQISAQERFKPALRLKARVAKN